MDPLIDYTGETRDNEESEWTPTAFKKYFIETYWKIHRAGGAVPWTLKQQVMLKTMMSEYDAKDLADMMLYWHINQAKPSVACRFVDLYSNRVDIYHKMKKTHEEYKWS